MAVPEQKKREAIGQTLSSDHVCDDCGKETAKNIEIFYSFPTFMQYVYWQNVHLDIYFSAKISDLTVEDPLYSIIICCIIMFRHC